MARKTAGRRLARKVARLPHSTLRGTAQAGSNTIRAAKENGQGDSFPIVGIGASAGGLEAFTELLTHLPADTGMAFVLIQHLDPKHESHLTQLLSRASKMPVSELKGDTRAEANHVYVIPPKCNLDISDGFCIRRPA